MPIGKILIGTSGWSYDDWVGPFYFDYKNMFSQYIEVFNTVEVNSTFYSYPTPGLIRGLIRSSPRYFKFSLKLPRLITHKKKFNPKMGLKSDIDRFIELVKPLREKGKLGAILVQLPPVSMSETPYLSDFLDLLPYDNFPFAVEFRNESWLNEEVLDTLKDRNIAYCIVDEPLLPPHTYVTADFSYIRWHGRGQRPWYYYLYTEEELKEWVPRVKEVASKVKVVYGYFNNHFRGFAPKNALQMILLLGIGHFGHEFKLKEIDKYFKEKAIEKAKKSFEELIARGEADVEDILLIFMNEKRLERAKGIPNSEVKLTITEEYVKARVKEYFIEIDLTNRRITHNCADWMKRIESKRFCKHLGKIFLVMPKDVALKILQDIAGNIDEWEFIYEEG